METKVVSDQGEAINETYDTDILVVGGGISGLAAAVEAGHQEGVEVLLVESNAYCGGNGMGVEGMLGVDSVMQKEADIHLDPVELIGYEHQQAQYTPNGSLWLDLIYNSAENVQWCLDQGVEYDKVDDYHGTCVAPTFHWFKGGVASKGYVPQMKKRAEELGVKFLLETPVTGLIEEDGKVVGAYSKTKNKNIKINAKAVILATGGIGGDKDLVHRAGWKLENTVLTGMPSVKGDGYKLAMSAGAMDTITNSCQLIVNYIQALPYEGVYLHYDLLNGMMGLPAGGPFLWVNQDGDRFVNENIRQTNIMLQSLAINSNKVAYMIFDQEIYDNFTKDIENAKEVLEKAVEENKGNSLYKADTFEELAEKVGLPKEEFLRTVDHYNEMAAEGRDIDFGKETDKLIPINKAPYYIARLDFNYIVGIGGIGSNKWFEVIDDQFDPIPGLYVAGMDTAMQYHDVYTINVGGSACAHNVNSGRTAVKSAKQYIDSL